MCVNFNIRKKKDLERRPPVSAALVWRTSHSQKRPCDRRWTVGSVWFQARKGKGGKRKERQLFHFFLSQVWNVFRGRGRGRSRAGAWWWSLQTSHFPPLSLSSCSVSEDTSPSPQIISYERFGP